MDHKVIWECENKHQFEAYPSNILPTPNRPNGGWCRECLGREKVLSPEEYLARYKQLAKERGGECLSTVYINSDTKLLWRCSKNHEWSVVPSGLIREYKPSWCPTCAKEQNQLHYEQLRLQKEK